jgi:sulfane dehydrogenase subunit SoxC
MEGVWVMDKQGLVERHPAVVMDPSTPFKRLGPVSRLKDFITPADHVHVLAHLGVAHVDPRQWQLRIDGLVRRPLVFGYDELLGLPDRDLTAVFECYGNPLAPDVPARSVANVVWRGVPLTELLDRAGVSAEATVACFEGLDFGTFAGTYCGHYVKDIPIARARRSDVLIAYEMNGRPLTHEHGFPARAVVPGYFGTNSVKWLSRITLAAARPEGLFTTRLYNRRVAGGGRGPGEPAQEVDVNAVIVRPADQDRLSPGRHVISGWAWSAGPVGAVAVSTDTGKSWHPAQLATRGPSPTWQRFEFHWEAAQAGAYEIRARATDRQGRVQPDEGRNAVHAITVTVE